MELPKKINPDNIREAVLELKYHSKLPFEILLGMFFNALDDSYTYTNRPIHPPTLIPGLSVNPGQELTINIGNISLFHNDKISVRVSPNSLVFACLEQYRYIGWENFGPEIERALRMLEKTGQITKWFRVGIRYISEYPKMDLKECIKFSFSFGLPEVLSETTAFKSEFFFQGSKVILNLNNKVQVIKQNISNRQQEKVPTSIIDVDVISDNLEITNLDELLKVIEETHIKEKKVYFGMLTESYLKSLNPEY